MIRNAIVTSVAATPKGPADVGKKEERPTGHIADYKVLPNQIKLGIAITAHPLIYYLQNMCVYCPTRLSSESLSRRNIPKDNLSDTWSTTLASTVILPLNLPRLFLVAAIPAKVILEAPRAEHPIATSAPHLVFVRNKLIAILAIAIRGVVEVEKQQRLPFAHDTHWFRLLLAVMRDLAATLRTFLG